MPLSTNTSTSSGSSIQPCSTCVHPASATIRSASDRCRWTTDRSPWARASPHAASSWAADMFVTPPNRMLVDAKTLTTSAPAAARSRTYARISSGVPVFSFTAPSDDSRRGPGISPRSIHARSSASRGEPRLCIVVIPFISVRNAFSAPCSVMWATLGSFSCRCTLPSSSKWFPMCTWVSM